MRQSGPCHHHECRFRITQQQRRLCSGQTGLFTQEVACAGYKDAPGNRSNAHLGGSEAELKETSEHVMR